jgi:hypothetical protein
MTRKEFMSCYVLDNNYSVEHHDTGDNAWEGSQKKTGSWWGGEKAWTCGAKKGTGKDPPSVQVLCVTSSSGLKSSILACSATAINQNSLPSAHGQG